MKQLSSTALLFLFGMLTASGAYAIWAMSFSAPQYHTYLVVGHVVISGGLAMATVFLSKQASAKPYMPVLAVVSVAYCGATALEALFPSKSLGVASLLLVLCGFAGVVLNKRLSFVHFLLAAVALPALLFVAR